MAVDGGGVCGIVAVQVSLIFKKVPLVQVATTRPSQPVGHAAAGDVPLETALRVTLPQAVVIVFAVQLLGVQVPDVVPKVPSVHKVLNVPV